MNPGANLFIYSCARCNNSVKSVWCKRIASEYFVYLFIFTAMPKRVENAKIACLDFSLQKAKMHLGVSVVVEDPEQLEAIRKR